MRAEARRGPYDVGPERRQRERDDRTTPFVPLTDITLSPESLRVGVPKEQVRDAPNIDTGGELSAKDESDLSSHFGLDYAPPANESGRRLARR